MPAAREPEMVYYSTNLNAHLHYDLGDDSYHLSGADKIFDNRLFGMCPIPIVNKDMILKSLT